MPGNLQERALPHLVGILGAPEAGNPTLTEGALDVTCALLRPAAPEQAARVHSAASGTVMALVLRADDPGILQSASEYLRHAHTTLTHSLRRFVVAVMINIICIACFPCQEARCAGRARCTRCLQYSIVNAVWNLPSLICVTPTNSAVPLGVTAQAQAHCCSLG